MGECHPIPAALSGGGGEILLVKPSSLGDVLHAFPAARLIKASFPGASLDWLIHPAYAPLLEYLGSDIRSAILFERQKFKGLGVASNLLRLSKDLRRRRYDLVLDMQGLLRSAIFARLCRSGHVVGFDAPKERPARWLYHRSHASPPGHAIERNLHLVAAALNLEPAAEPRRLALPVIPRHRAAALAKLAALGVAESDSYIAAAPGSRWETKRWGTGRFAETLDFVQAQNPALKVLLVGSADEDEAARGLAAACVVAKPVSLVGKTSLCELLELLRGARVFLTNDSGPMHLAALLGTPLAAFFGPTDPVKTGPFWERSAVFQGDCGCIKCLRRYCDWEAHDCRADVAPRQVAGRILDFLREGSRR